MTVVPIVEGESEVVSFPILLRRLTDWLFPGRWVEVLKPIKVQRNQFLNKPEEFRRFLLLARGKASPSGAIVILLDADDDCPANLGTAIRERVKETLGEFPTSVVLANREYEAWFIATAPSLDGKRQFHYEDGTSIDPESPRDAKRWISDRMVGKPYREVLDQPALTEAMDLTMASEKSRSFRKLCSDWKSLVSAQE